MSKICWLKRQAVQIAAQLPDDPEQAIQVLGYAKEIVEKFLRDDQGEGVVLKFPVDSGANSRAS